MAILLSVVAALVPLLIAPGFSFYFDITPKVTTLLLGVSLALLFAAFTGSLPTLPRGSPLRLLLLLLAAQAILLCLSTAFSENPILSLGGGNWRRFGLLTQSGLLAFVILAAIAFHSRPASLRTLLRCTTLAGIAASIYGVAQYFGWDPWLPTAAYHVGEGEYTIVRPPSTLGHAGYAATYFLHVIFGGLALALLDSRSLWRRTGLAAAALASLAVVLSGTRAALLGLLIGAALLLFRMSPNWNWRRVLATAAAVAALLTVLFLSPAGEKLRARAHWSTEDAWGGARLLLWRDSLRMAVERPFTGWGPETFAGGFPRFQSKGLARAYPDFYHESPHNIFLDLLTAQGVLAAATLAALCWLAIHRGWQTRSPSKSFMLALACGLIASLVSLQFTALTVPTALYLYLTIAMLLAAGAGSKTGTMQPPLLGVSHKLLRVAAVTLALTWGAYATHLSVADRLLARSQQALRSGRPQIAAALHEGARHWQPGGGGSDLWFSRALARLAADSSHLVPGVFALQEGFAAARRATRTAEDRHNAFYNLAAYYALREDPEGAEQSLRDAIRWAPNWFKPHWMLAGVLNLTGRQPEAQQEAAIARDLNGGKNPEVAQTLADIEAEIGR